MQVKISRFDYLPSGIYELVETNGKLAKAIQNVGPGASSRAVLIEHDKLGGLIHDNGKPISVHTFWNIEKVKILQRQRRKNKWDKTRRVLIFVGKYVFAPLFIAYLIYIFGWNK